jgi:hypothetical protein
MYGALSLLSAKIPGVEQLIDFISHTDSSLIFFTAFLSIFIEGLYIVGAFFPGATLIVVVTLLSQTVSQTVFFLTILSIFIGWCLSGVVNIFIGGLYRKSMVSEAYADEFMLKDRVWTTWFPSFRASYEVSQIVEGGEPWPVFLSSVRVKLLASMVIALGTFALAYLIDIKEVNNEEGVASLFVIASITLCVGIIKLRRYLNTKSDIK